MILQLFFPFSKKQKCSWKGSMTKRKQNYHKNNYNIFDYILFYSFFLFDFFHLFIYFMKAISVSFGDTFKQTSGKIT